MSLRKEKEEEKLKNSVSHLEKEAPIKVRKEEEEEVPKKGKKRKVQQ